MYGDIYCFTSHNIKNENEDKTIFVNDINIGKTERASCSYPVVFSPMDYKNIKFVDGGLRENIPWREVKLLGANKVINIAFEEKETKECNKNLVEIAETSIGLIGYIQTKNNIEQIKRILNK